MAITSQPLGQILKEMGKISELDIQEALQTQKDKGGAIGKILVDKGLVNDDDIRLAIARQSGMEPVDLGEVVMTADLLDMVPAHVAETYQVIPVDFDGSVLTLALADPQNVSALDDMKFMLNVDVKGALSDPAAVEAALEKYYSDRSESMESLLGSMDGGDMEVMDDNRHEMMDMDQLEKDVNAAPVVKLLNMVLLSAIKDRASDIHLEPFEKELKIRYRVDGVLYEMMPPPIQLARAVLLCRTRNWPIKCAAKPQFRFRCETKPIRPLARSRFLENVRLIARTIRETSFARWNILWAAPSKSFAVPKVAGFENYRECSSQRISQTRNGLLAHLQSPHWLRCLFRCLIGSIQNALPNR